MKSVPAPRYAASLNVLDRIVAAFSPAAGVQRAKNRHILAALKGYEASEASRKRRFHRNEQSGDALARVSAVALRNQARHLERNHDLARGILDKLVDFTIGPQGITVEPQPKRLDGSLHVEYAAELERDYALWSQWPEVTWTHDRASMERLAARTWFRDGEVLGQLVGGPIDTLQHGSSVPFSIEMLEPDYLEHDQDVFSNNTRQGIERNSWGRPVAYNLLLTHPGDDFRGRTFETKRVPAERMLHVRTVDRIGQLRGVSLFASVLTRLQDLFEYEDSERIAAKMAASYVVKMTRGDASMWDPANNKYDPQNPPIFQLDGGMIVANTAPGEDVEFFDSKRPNSGAEPWIQGEHRNIAAGVGLSYSAVSRNYNGTYSAQRQELSENWPHYHALTGIFVAQWSRPGYQEFCKWRALVKGVPADLDVSTLSDALYLGPPMPAIDPLKETDAQISLVQAGFKSSAQVIRERGGVLRDVYKQLASEVTLRQTLGINSTTDQTAPPRDPNKVYPSDAPAQPGEVDREKQAQTAPAARLRIIK